MYRTALFSHICKKQVFSWPAQFTVHMNANLLVIYISSIHKFLTVAFKKLVWFTLTMAIGMIVLPSGVKMIVLL